MEFAFSVSFKHNVVRYGKRRRQAHAESVLGNETHRNSLFDYRFRGKPQNAFAFVHYKSALNFSEPGNRLAEFFLSATRNAGNAENFAASYIKVNVLYGFASVVGVDV